VDPNETLSEIRSIVARIQDGPEDVDEQEPLADLVHVLDLWLSHGGFLPDAWRI